jgi:hypothetical protein
MHTATVSDFLDFKLPTLPELRINLKRIFALMLCCVMLYVTVGCTQADVKTAVQDIANAIPQVQPYITTAQAIIDSLDPAAAPIVDAAVGIVQTSLTELQVLLNAYAASPSTSAWQSIVDAVTTIVNTNATNLLSAAHIVNPDSRAKALLVLGGIQSGLLLLLSIIQRVKDAVTSLKLKAAAANASTKISEYRQYLDKQGIETATGYSFDRAVAFETSQGF